MARATHFWPSRSTANPGTASTTARSTARPGPVAIAAGSSTLSPANTSSGRAEGRRARVGTPQATIASSTRVATTAKAVVRACGTASAFQMPPSPARLPRVPRPGSARAAKGATPAACGVPSAVPSADAVSQGDAASTAMTRTAAAQRNRAMPEPGTVTHVRPTIPASSSPVGVSPASAIQNTTAAQSPPRGGPVRSRSTAAATHGRQP